MLQGVSQIVISVIGSLILVSIIALVSFAVKNSGKFSELEGMMLRLGDQIGSIRETQVMRHDENVKRFQEIAAELRDERAVARDSRRELKSQVQEVVSRLTVVEVQVENLSRDVRDRLDKSA